LAVAARQPSTVGRRCRCPEGDEEEPVSTSPEVEVGARSRILDAAAEAFMANGFATTTIDDIARDVGATKGLVYYHFRSKFDIFLAVYGEGMRRVRERVEPHAEGTGTGCDRLVAMSIAHLLNLMEDLAYHHVVHQAVRGEASVALKDRQRDALLALNRLRKDYEQMFHRVVVDGIDDGSLRRVDPTLATRTLLSNLNAVDAWYRRVDGQVGDELHDLARRIVDLLVGGLAD
jgi:AcrR family transcriptional regulator